MRPNSHVVRKVLPLSIALVSLTTDPNHVVSGYATRNTKPDLPIFSPHFGGCYDSARNLLTCAIGPSNCPSETSYLLPTEIDASHCHSPHHTRSGRCPSESSETSSSKGPCTPDPASCPFASLESSHGSVFDPSPSASSFDDTCSVLRDDGSSPTLVSYPHCRSVNPNPYPSTRCVLSRDDCDPALESFHPVSTTTTTPDDPKCTCYHVPTGMCRLPSTSPTTRTATSFCAVAAYDCPTGYEFVSASDVEKEGDEGGVDRKCRLCGEEAVEGYEEEDGSSVGAFWYRSTKKVVVEAKVEANAVVETEGEKEVEVLEAKGDGGKNTTSWLRMGLIGVGAVAGVVLVGVLSLNSYYKHHDPRVTVMEPSRSGSSYLTSSITSK